jgi:hypothetical protein
LAVRLNLVRVDRLGVLANGVRNRVTRGRRGAAGGTTDAGGGAGTAGTESSRRTALKQAAALAAGAAGLVVVDATRGLAGLEGRRASLTGAIAAPAAAAVPQAHTATTFLTMYGRAWELGASNRRPGTLPGDGDRAGAKGELLAAPEGEAIGSFRSAWFFEGNSVGGLEMHTFQLADGLLIGLGTSQYGEGTYAVVGGTGRFAGASGSYRATQQIREVGGDGTAKFDFELTGGARNGF